MLRAEPARSAACASQTSDDERHDDTEHWYGGHEHHIADEQQERHPDYGEANLDDERGNQLSGLVFDYLRSDRMHVVLVGDPDIIRSQVPPLGKGQLVELRFASE